MENNFEMQHDLNSNYIERSKSISHFFCDDQPISQKNLNDSSKARSRAKSISNLSISKRSKPNSKDSYFDELTIKDLSW